MRQVNSTSSSGLDQFVVDGTASLGAYTTIQEAVDAAFTAGGGTVYVKKGFYNENVALASGVYIVGAAVNNTNEAAIGGTVSFTDIAGDSGIQSMNIQGQGANPGISINQTIASTVNIGLTGCQVSSATGVGIDMNASTGATVGLTTFQCEMSGTTNGIVMTGPGNTGLQCRYCGVSASTGAAIVLGAAANAFTFYSLINSNNLGITLNDPTSNFIMVNGFGSFANELVTFNAAAQAIIVNCGFSCAAGSGNWAAGAAGTLIYGQISALGSTGIAATLTKAPAGQLPYSTAGNSGSAVRGHAAFDSATFTVIDGFVQTTGSATSWKDVTANQSIVNGEGYSVSANAVVLTLPVTAAFGTAFKVSLEGGTSWQIAQNAGQSIRFGNVSTTVGTGGNLESIDQGNTVSLVCDVADTHWFVENSMGNITVV